MNKIKILKGRIKSKFGTISRFCRAANVSKTPLNKLLYLANAEKLSPYQRRKVMWYTRLITHSDPYGSSRVDITPRLLKLIRRAIDASGGVTEWHTANPEFTLSTVKGLYHGYRKLRTPAVNKILAKLDIK